MCKLPLGLRMILLTTLVPIPFHFFSIQHRARSVSHRVTLNNRMIIALQVCHHFFLLSIHDVMVSESPALSFTPCFQTMGLSILCQYKSIFMPQILVPCHKSFKLMSLRSRFGILG
ncbi:hypothetical protein M758_4G257600 [Ceratodon purpureus]|nr:hypothetical protein M758_4G257600 [Ceratodon purpureus]